ncbi:RHS repeat-associated core domain-containing protein [Polaribacter cellanae]
MNGRMYDAKLGRFLSPDNYIQEPFSTQSFNRYGYVWNNPLKFTDKSGEFIVAALIGALISVATNGIINVIEGRPFFQGAGLAALTGAIGGVFAKAIGNAVKGLKGILKVGVQAVAHGHLGGMMSLAMGGDYFSGFAAGAVGSAIGHYALKGLERVGANNFWKAAGTITAGSLSGGIGSVIAGGKFWDGFRNGAISTSLNHVMHMVKNAVQKAKRLVVGIYGAGGEGSGDGSTLKKYVENKGGKMFEFYEEGKALDYVKNNHNGKSIEIYGYSRGGNVAISIVNSLGNAGIYVSRLVTFDPHHLWSGTFKLKHRVGKVLNFYQRNPRTGGILGWWGKNP